MNQQSDNKQQVDSVDEDLYSRQLLTYGKGAMKRMTMSSVLVLGLNGLGVEIAKNIILAGVKMVTLGDSASAKVSYTDLVSNYYATEEDVGKHPLEVVLPKLAELNENVRVEPLSFDPFGEDIGCFDVVVMVNHSLDAQLKMNEHCRLNSVKFVSASTVGLFGQIFVDFNETMVDDVDGEEPFTGHFSNFTEEGVITTVEPHNLYPGLKVRLMNVDSSKDVNEQEFVVSKYIDRVSFGIDCKGVGYKKGGQFVQVKDPVKVEHVAMRESMMKPNFLETSFLPEKNPMNLHNMFMNLDRFARLTGTYPESWNEKDAEGFNKLLSEMIGDSYNETIEKLGTVFSSTCRGRFGPIDSVLGGFVAQEVIKGCSGKYMPLSQWLYYDCIDTLPDDFKVIEEDAQPESTRYDGLVKIFGKKFCQEVRNKKGFIVGAGAIGCELLKNFALLGIGDDLGSVTVTDMDTIEKSNLNRQFLFRHTDIGKAKSEAAASAVTKMNPRVKVTYHLNRVGEETENIYNDDFFEKLDFVANALDNVQARKYVDLRCVSYDKPLFESGTLGTKGNTQVVIPHLTECYSDSVDPPQKSIPLCTIKNFPYEINHTVQWARSEFEGMFADTPTKLKRYAEEEAYLDGVPDGEKASTVKTILDFYNHRPSSFEDCMRTTYLQWHTQYRDNIMALQKQYPEDAKTSEGGDFWVGTKKYPKIATFDPTSKLHFDYVYYGAILFGQMWGIDKVNEEEAKTMLQTFVSPEPKLTAKFGANEAEQKEADKDAIEEFDLDKGLSELQKLDKTIRVTPHSFEKDDPKNYHIDFLTACSNMRAYNYHIESADELKTKGIAGKIIPAIATTTTMVAGLVAIEMLKYFQGHDNVEKYNNTFINLAIPLFTSSDPIESKKEKVADLEYDATWDKIVIKGDRKLKDLFVEIEKWYADHQTAPDSFKYEVEGLFKDTYSLYQTFGMSSKKQQTRMDMNISEIIKMVSKKDELDQSVVLIPIITVYKKDDDDEWEEIEFEPHELPNFPDVKLYFEPEKVVEKPIEMAL